jgi:hypothetical protein
LSELFDLCADGDADYKMACLLNQKDAVCTLLKPVHSDGSRQFELARESMRNATTGRAHRKTDNRQDHTQAIGHTPEDMARSIDLHLVFG